MHPTRLLRNVITPSGIGVSIYALLTSLILVASNSAPLFNQLVSPDTKLYIDAALHHYEASGFTTVNQSLIVGKMSVFVLWAAFGAIAYLVIWLTINTYIALNNDIVVGATYTNFKKQGRLKYFAEITLQALFRLSSVLLMLLLAIIVLHTWYPLSITMFRVWFEHLWSLSSWVFLLMAYLGWFVVFHVATILLRLSLLRVRVMG